MSSVEEVIEVKVGKIFNQAIQLFMRDLVSTSKNLFFSYAWIAITPLLGLVLIAFLKARGILNIPDTTTPYLWFLVFNYAHWRLLKSLLSVPGMSLKVYASSMLRLPLSFEGFLIYNLFKSLLDYVIRLIPLIFIGIYFSYIPEGSISIFILGLISLIVIGLGIGFFVSPLTLFIADFAKLWGTIIPGLIFLCPVFYPMPSYEGYGIIVHLNPLALPIYLTQGLLGDISLLSMGYLSGLLIFSVLMLVIGLINFKKSANIINQLQ